MGWFKRKQNFGEQLSEIERHVEEGKNMEAYCVKCKHKTEIKEGKEVKNKKGMRMMKGVCPKCGTTVCRILGK